MEMFFVFPLTGLFFTMGWPFQVRRKRNWKEILVIFFFFFFKLDLKQEKRDVFLRGVLFDKLFRNTFPS